MATIKIPRGGAALQPQARPRVTARTDSPKPEAIRAARAAAGLTQAQAGALIYSTMRTWQDWEAGARRMHPALFELFLLKSRGLTAPRAEARGF